MLRARPDGWWGVALSPLITQTREYNIIHRLSAFPVHLCSFCFLQFFRPYQDCHAQALLVTTCLTILTNAELRA